MNKDYILDKYKKRMELILSTLFKIRECVITDFYILSGISLGLLIYMIITHDKTFQIYQMMIFIASVIIYIKLRLTDKLIVHTTECYSTMSKHISNIFTTFDILSDKLSHGEIIEFDNTLKDMSNIDEKFMLDNKLKVAFTSCRQICHADMSNLVSDKMMDVLIDLSSVKPLFIRGTLYFRSYISCVKCDLLEQKRFIENDIYSFYSFCGFKSDDNQSYDEISEIINKLN